MEGSLRADWRETMKANSSIIAELALVACIALPSWVNAACPGPQTYFFSGHGDVILQNILTKAPCDADVALNGDMTTQTGVSCLPGCPAQTTARASITEVIKTGAFGIQLDRQVGISCDQIASVTIAADYRFEPPLQPLGTPTRTLNNFTIRSSVPTPVLSDSFPPTSQFVFTSYVGSTLDTVSYISADEKAFDMVATHSAGRGSPIVPCPSSLRVEQFTPAIDIQGHSVLNSVAP
jgi:hypothetical protein